VRSADPNRTSRSRNLRRAETPAEKRLWTKLRDRRLGGLKFVRQAPIGPYYADFLCRERQLIVEVDGATHSTDAEIARDALRTAFLERVGYRVLRIQNIEIFENIDGVCETIRRAVHGGKSPSPQPSPRARGEGERLAIHIADEGRALSPLPACGERVRVRSKAASQCFREKAGAKRKTSSELRNLRKHR
jgi:very-short-patch-repair endonuclease